MENNKNIFIVMLIAFYLPLHQALTNLKISFFYSETIITILLAISLAIFIAYFYLHTTQRVKVLILSLIVFFFFDLAIEYASIIIHIIPDIYSDDKTIKRITLILFFFITLSAIYTSIYLFKNNILSILSIFFITALITTLINQPTPKLFEPAQKDETIARLNELSKKSGNSESPIILHIILDELYSPSAIHSRDDNGNDIFKNMLAFDKLLQFRVYGRVYSRHYFTATSLPNMMAAEFNSSLNIPLKIEQNSKPNENLYFDDYHSNGYKIVVYQSDHIDFCLNDSVSICNTFDSFDPKWQVSWGSKDKRDNDRLKYLWLILLRGYDGSYTSKYMRKLFDESHTPERFDVPGFPLWFDMFEETAINIPRGTMLFAHFMVPHAPYLLTKDCQVKAIAQPHGYYLGDRIGNDANAIDSARVTYHKEYSNQTTCVLNKLTHLLEAIAQLKKYDDATIIIHGDHGSRISVGDKIEDYNERDFIDNYATFYAIRKPGITSGYDCKLISLPQLFSVHMSKNIPKIDSEIKPASVYVDSNQNSERREYDMPEFDCIEKY